MTGLSDRLQGDSTITPLVSLGAGAAILQEVVAGAEIVGLAMGAAGDEIYHFMPIPWDLDRDFPIRYRVWFSHSATDADAPIWKVFAKFIGKQIAITDAASSGDDALTFGAHTVSTTADALEVTAWKEGVSHNKIAETDFGMLLSVECDNLGSASANEITLLGLEIDYTVGAAPEAPRRVTKDAPTTGTNVDSD
jgi:hypothetical protein